MTQPQTLNVEKDELLARAAELEQPITGQPAGNPAAPCSLSMITKAAQQIALSADNMRLYLGVGERERLRLAESLRNAAKAYEDADEGAADALNTDGTVSVVKAGSASEDTGQAMLNDTLSLMAQPEPFPYYPVRVVAQEIVQLDQGTAFLDFADAWEAYQRALLEARYRFRPFQHWLSESSNAVEMNFDSQRSWLDSMATLCGQMATQARTVVSAHRWAVKEHPTLARIEEVDKIWVEYSSNDLFRRVLWPQVKTQLEAQYAECQRKSEEVLTEYEKRAALPLAPLSPPKPPPAHRIDPPPKPDPGDGGRIAPTNPEDGLPLDDSLLPDPTGMPMMPMMPSIPSMPSAPTDARLTAALKDLKKGPGLPTGAGVKPASFGGGGVPGMPLQPSAEPEAATSRPAGAAGPAAAGVGRGLPGAGGAIGGGMGGMAPMGGAPGGQGQGAGKGKRTQTEDESLYTEERPWTEGVVGRRRAKDAPDSKDPK